MDKVCCIHTRDTPVYGSARKRNEIMGTGGFRGGDVKVLKFGVMIA